jgi:hypothetical protein
MAGPRAAARSAGGGALCPTDIDPLEIGRKTEVRAAYHQYVRALGCDAGRRLPPAVMRLYKEELL